MGGKNALPIPNGCEDQVSNVKSDPTSPCQDPGKVHNVPGEHTYSFRMTSINARLQMVAEG